MNSLFKKVATTLLLVITPFTLTGCSLKSTISPKSSGQTLTIWRQPINKKPDDQVFNAILAAFKKKNPAVKIDYRTFTATQDYETLVINALAAGKGPDIWEIRNDELPRHLEKLSPYPSTTPFDPVEFKKSYAPVIADEMISDGKFYGMPMGLDPLALYLNSDHLQEARLGNQDLPKTWADTLQLAVALTRKVGTTILRPGLALGTTSNIDRSSQILELLMQQFRTQMVDPAHRTATFDLYNQDPTGKQFTYPGQVATQFYTAFSVPESGFQTWDATQPYSTEAFAQGNLSMMINYLSVAPQLKEINPKLRFETLPPPQIDSRTYPQGDLPGTVADPIYTARYRSLVVSKPWAQLSTAQQTAKQQLAWNFVSYATAPKAADAFSQANWLISPNLPTDNVEITNTTVSDSKPVEQYLVTWYKGKSPRSVDKALSQMLQAITEGAAPIPATMTQAAQYITSLLQ